MDNVQDLVLVGLSHRTAPIAVRERYAVQPEDLEACLRDLHGASGVEEAWLLSTCNRTEALLLTAGREDAELVARQRVFRNLADEHVYAYRGVQAIIHLFRVASGIDSQVIGESEILGQLKRAFERAQRVGTVGPSLSPLLSQSLQVGKRVRSETGLGQGSLSVARVGVDVAKQIFGGFTSCRALVIGAGETGRLVAQHLAAERIGTIDFANRTPARAEAAAREFGGVAFALADLPQATRGADIIVACVEGQGGVLRPDAFDRRELRGRDRPVLVLDLSLPRAVDLGVEALENLLCYDLDALQPVVEGNRQQRDEAAEQAAGIVVGEVHKFLVLRTYAAFSPAIGELRRRFDELREEVLDRITGGRAGAREIQLAHELSARLLDLSLEKMKDGARHARSEAVLDREYQRFLENL